MPLETESSAFVETELALIALPLEHTKGDETTPAMMHVGPCGACLTARQPELILTRLHTSHAGPAERSSKEQQRPGMGRQQQPAETPVGSGSEGPRPL